MRALFLFTVLIANVSFSNAQLSVRELEKYLTEIRTKPHQSIPKAILQDDKNEGKLLRVLQPYTSDSVLVVRSRVYSIIKLIGKKSKDTSIRQLAVGYLIKGIQDKDTGVSGGASEALRSFDKRDFNNDAIESLKVLVDLKTPHLNTIIKITGYLGLVDLQPAFAAIMASKAKATDKWACQLALARMGDQTAINFILDKVKNSNINDDLIYSVVPDLVYTKQKVLLDYLVEIIQHDTPSCQSANPDSNTKILCGYRVMELIAPAIEDYPLSVDAFGDLTVSDYAQALTTVRLWFSGKSDYKIKTENY
jgi:hypothetical protein